MDVRRPRHVRLLNAIVRTFPYIQSCLLLFQRLKYCITSRSRWQPICGKAKCGVFRYSFGADVDRVSSVYENVFFPRSLGVTTYVLLTGFSPFGGETDQETFQNISLGDVDFPEELFEDISAQAKDFVAKLLVLDPRYRVATSESFFECFQFCYITIQLVLFDINKN